MPHYTKICCIDRKFWVVLVSPIGNVNGRITIEPASTVAPGTNITIVCTGIDAKPPIDPTFEPSQYNISSILIIGKSDLILKSCITPGADKRECTFSRPNAQKSDALNYSCVFKANILSCVISQALTVTDNGKRHNRIIIHYFVFVVCLLFIYLFMNLFLCLFNYSFIHVLFIYSLIILHVFVYIYIGQLKLPEEDLVDLTRLILRNNYFEFDDKIYKQKLGTVIGTNLRLVCKYFYVKTGERC